MKLNLYKTTFFFLFVSLMTIGCSTFTMSDENYSNHLNLDELQPEPQVDSELSEQLGYVHYTADDKDEFTGSKNFIGVNRSQTADMITRHLLLSADFSEVASLVTDKEIIIAYERQPTLSASMAKDIAAKTAASFVPGFYQIYTTNDADYIDRIQQIHLSSAQNKVNTIEIEKIIQDMNKSH